MNFFGTSMVNGINIQNYDQSILQSPDIYYESKVDNNGILVISLAIKGVHLMSYSFILWI